MSTSWDWPGSRWWRVDFHAHSPESYDFKNPPDQENPNWTGWISAARDAGIQVIAVTDHNTASAVSFLQGAVSDVNSAPVLFPGVELTASDGSHLLLLMDPACKQVNVEHLLSRLEVSVNQRGQQSGRSSLSIVQILEKCGDEALVIGAHVNGPDGLLEHDGLQLIEELCHPRLVAVEIDPTRKLDQSRLDGSLPQIKRRVSQVWSSDGHRIDQLGRRFTWVKMTTPNMEGLRLALLDGDQSLKPAAQGDSDNPNAYADLAIESITVHKSKFIGQPDPVTVGFNPWLNAIIGGRGTGKSTLIDFCRKTLRRESELDGRDDDGDDGSLRSLFDRRMRVPPQRGDAGLLTGETCIEVIYRKDGERFLLSWNQNGGAPSISWFDGDELTPQEGDIRERFPVRIYSQKQLFALAQDSNALLTVIDDSQSVRRVELDRTLEQLKARYLSLCAEARVARSRADNLPARRAAHADIQHKLDVFQTGGHTQVMNGYRITRQQDETWKAILLSVSQAIESVGLAVEELSVTDLGLVADDDLARAGLRRAHEALNQTVENFQQGVRQSVERTQQEIEQIRTGADADLWRQGVDASEGQFREASVQLAVEGILNPNEYDALLEQEATLASEIEDLGKEQEQAGELENDAAKTLVEYRDQRSELSKRRKHFAKNTSNDTIQVEIGAYANYRNLSNELGEILGIERFEYDRQIIARRIQPQQDQSWDWEGSDGVVADIRRFLSGEVDTWQTQDRRFEAALRRVPPERVDRLALYLPEDAVTVSYHNYQGNGWQSLAQGSPGQQTAALLAFVLGYGSEPIILDQPEDDLDNTLIYNLLVSRLRETKRKRQVIVVTHNPNIVVHGDAELVLSLKAAAGQSHIACQGGLQERQVRDEICNVMEGGREAFESRYQRIMHPEQVWQ